LRRGIPLFVANLESGLVDAGHETFVLRAPQWLGCLPRSLAHAAAILVEQLVVPAYAALRHADAVVYPYNTASLLDLATGHARIVVHDLEPFRKRPLSAARVYAEVCARAISMRSAPVFTVSEPAREEIAAHPLFRRSKLHVIPNTFFRFEEHLRAAVGTAQSDGHVLLSTGHTPNKDLETVASTLLPLVLAAGYTVHVLGLHADAGRRALAAAQVPQSTGRLVLHGKLPDADVARLYRSAAAVWVHSRSEGFGRPVVEGRLAGRPVVCSDIAAFRALADAGVHFYAAPEDLVRALRAATAAPPREPYTGFDYRAAFRASLEGFLCARS
jgi:glycosyltransferase involved in cell wall biosynthesis